MFKCCEHHAHYQEYLTMGERPFTQWQCGAGAVIPDRGEAQSVPGGTRSVGTPADGGPLSPGAGAVVVAPPVGTAVVGCAVGDGRAAGVPVRAVVGAGGLGRRVVAAGGGSPW